jgi:O-antigen ligase
VTPLPGGLSLGRLRAAQANALPPAGPDTTTGLTFLVVLTFGIPAQLVLGPLGAAGTPAKVLGCFLLLWWVLDRLVTGLARPADSPIRKALFAFALAVLASYAAGASRPMVGTEQRSADRLFISIASWIGIVLFAGALRHPQRLDALLRRVVLAGGSLAAFGIVQSITGQTWVDRLHVPGLTLNSPISLVGDRNGFARPAGTATSPIEFGVVLTMVLPLAIHYALNDAHRPWYRRVWPVAAIGFAVPISISRSAVLGAVVVLLMLLPTWSAPRRRRAYVVLGVGASVVYVMIPGLLGSIRNMFTGAGNDASVRSRTDSYALALDLFGRSPWFGRGLGTFIPSYRIVDNQYLGSLVEMGLVGLGAMLVLFLGTIVVAVRVRRLTTDPKERDLSMAVAASIGAGIAGFVTFDAFAFPMLTSLLFMTIGCVDALYRQIAHARFDGSGGSTVTAGRVGGKQAVGPSEGLHGLIGPITGRLRIGSLRQGSNR